MERTIELIDILHEDYYAIGRAQYPAKAVQKGHLTVYLNNLL